MSLTIRNTLVLVLLVFAIGIASTLSWVTSRYDQFARDTVLKASSKSAIDLVHLHIDRYHDRIVVPFVDGWSIISTLTNGMLENDENKLTISVDRMFSTMEVKNELIFLHEIAVYDADMAFILNSTRGTGENLSQHPDLIAQFREFSRAKKRRGFAALWQTGDGRPLQSIFRPIGGFRLLGYIEYVIDPSIALGGMAEAIDGAFELHDASHHVLIRSELPDQLDRNSNTIWETIEFPIPGVMGKPWAIATIDQDVQAIHQESGLLQSQAITIVIGMSAIALIFGLIIVHRLIFDRIRRFSTLLRSLSAGNTSFELEAASDEFSEMHDAVGTLRDTVEQRQKLQTRLERELEERRVMTAQLRKSKIAADDANKAKSEFLASMSHELRTPLNAISGFAEMIYSEALGKIGNPKYVEYAKDIAASGSHLLSIINDILDLSKIEAGKKEIELSQFDVAEEIAESARLVNFKGQRNADNIVVEIAPDATALQADIRSFRQILINLLSNADKYTPEDGTISVAVLRDEDQNLMIKVTDSGVGITPEDIDRVLEPFGQARESSELAHQGTGLGLPLAMHLMKLHGGSLSIDSEPGQGTTVTLIFPDSPEDIALSA